MKLTQSQVVELLKHAGLADVEVVADEAAADYNQDDALKAIDNERSKILKPRIEQELSESVKSSEIGKMSGIINSALAKASGLKRADIEKLEKFEERIEAAFNHKSSQLEGDQKAIDNRIKELVDKHNADLEALKNDYDGQLTEAKNQYIDRDITSYIGDKLKDAPILDTADRSIAAQDFKRHLQEKYHLTYDEAEKAVRFYQKDNPQMPALNASGTAAIDVLGEAKTYFEPRGLWQKDMRHKNAGAEMQNHPNIKNFQPSVTTQPDALGQLQGAIAKL
jgi:hypothetical protein